MEGFDSRLIVLAAALIIDACLGEPTWLWRKLAHPVVLIGKVIAWLDLKFNLDSLTPSVKQVRGAIVAFLLVAGAVATGAMVHWILAKFPASIVTEAIVLAIILSGRSLYDHVAAVATGLQSGGLEGGRDAVRHIVGRNPDNLDETGIVRAAIESLAENFSDGVVAPALWYLAFGLPGLIAYKAINTGDSMIGYRNEKYEDFGKATAHLDDVVNFIPARISALLILIASFFTRRNTQQAFAIMMSDASKQRSPNAGWPEAATAGALDISLAGPRVYGDKQSDDPLVNQGGRQQLVAKDISAALLLIASAFGVMFIVIFDLAAVYYLT